MLFWRRARAILVPLAFYLVLGVASGYLVWGASNGDRLRGAPLLTQVLYSISKRSPGRCAVPHTATSRL